jgi:circadian clock protein KaiB
MKKSASTAPGTPKEQRYILKLYIAANEQNSQLARQNLKRVCDQYLNGLCQIDEVDVLTDYASALKDRVFVTPTLILVSPEPRATVVGNLDNKEKLILALRLRVEHGK